MTVVLHTNVMVSALINPEGIPATILSLLLNGKLTVQYDNRILEEYTEVLSQSRSSFKKNLIRQLLDYIQNEGEFITAEPARAHSVNPGDRAFYEVAKTGNAQYLITGNKKHFPDEETVRSPKEFLEAYLAER